MRKYSDIDLINNLKNNVDPEESLTLLVERHSGIYLDMVNSYASPNSPYINYNDLIKDKDYKIYDAAIKFDETKGAKFSTYLGNETKWMCLNIYNRNKRRPAFFNEFLENMSEEEHQQFYCDTISQSIKEDLLAQILSKVKSLPDKRISKIFEMRYIVGRKNKLMPWKDIGKKMKLSIQGCINIHNTAVKEIQKQLIKEF